MRVNETSGELNFSYKYKCQWNGFVVQWISMTDYNRIFLMRPGNPYWLIVPWGRIYVSVNWVIIGSGNGFSLVTWTNAASRQQVSVKFKSEFYHFHSINSFENIVCQNGGHFVKGGGWVQAHRFFYSTDRADSPLYFIGRIIPVLVKIHDVRIWIVGLIQIPNRLPWGHKWQKYLNCF